MIETYDRIVGRMTNKKAEGSKNGNQIDNDDWNDEARFVIILCLWE